MQQTHCGVLIPFRSTVPKRTYHLYLHVSHAFLRSVSVRHFSHKMNVISPLKFTRYFRSAVREIFNGRNVQYVRFAVVIVVVASAAPSSLFGTRFFIRNSPSQYPSHSPFHTYLNFAVACCRSFALLTRIRARTPTDNVSKNFRQPFLRSHFPVAEHRHRPQIDMPSPFYLDIG